MDTVIHHCQNCTESYCLLCAHENGYCLTCEADLEVSNVMDPSPCSAEIDKTSVFPNQSSIETSDPCPSAVFQLPLQIMSDDAAATLHLDQSDHPLSQGNLMTLLQLHCRVKNFERVLKATNIMIREIQEETERELWKQKNEMSVLFNIAQTFDA